MARKKKTETDAKMAQAIPSMEELFECFDQYEKNTDEAFHDLSTAKFKINDEGFASLVFEDDEEVEYFFPRGNALPLKQALKVVRVPYSFFRGCSQELKLQIMEEWLPKLGEEEDKEGNVSDRKDVLLKYRTAEGNRRVLRAVVPYTYKTTKNTTILQVLLNVKKEGWRVIAVQGTTVDSEQTTLRVVTDKKVTVNSVELLVGFDLTFSDVGCSNFVINVVLYNENENMGLIPAKAMKPYLTMEYTEELNAEAIAESIETLVEMAEEKSSDIGTVLKNGIEETIDKESKRKDMTIELSTLNEVRGVSKPILNEVRQDLENLDTRWAFVRSMAVKANGISKLPRRQKTEAAAAKLLGLDLTELFA